MMIMALDLVLYPWIKCHLPQFCKHTNLLYTVAKDDAKKTTKCFTLRVCLKKNVLPFFGHRTDISPITYYYYVQIISHITQRAMPNSKRYVPTYIPSRYLLYDTVGYLYVLHWLSSKDLITQTSYWELYKALNKNTSLTCFYS